MNRQVSLLSLPAVSVVIPSLNQGHFIRSTLDSLLAQAYPNIEPLVVDGGSTDGTLDTLASYGSRLRWVSEADGGQSSAINKGWRMTRGDIVAYLNADDTYQPGAIGTAVDFLQAHPEVDAVYGDCDYVDAAGDYLRPYPARPYDYLALVTQAVNYIPQPALFMRRKLLDSVGDLDESLHYVMDFDYWLRAGLGHRMAYLPRRLAALRLHPAAKSLRALGRFADELIRIYEKLFETPGLPGALRKVQAKAMSNVHYRAASCAFWSGETASARRLALRAWRCRLLNVRAPLFLALAGARAKSLVERWRGNPYMLRSL